MSTVNRQSYHPIETLKVMVNEGDVWRWRGEGGGGEVKGFTKHSPDKFIIFLFPYTVVGKFNDPETKQVVQSVDLGEEFSYACPQHSPSYGVSYSWVGKSAGSDIQFTRNERRAITQTGHLFIMFVTEDDLKELEGYQNQGIHCDISAAKRFESSSLLKLTKKNQGEFFVFS